RLGGHSDGSKPKFLLKLSSLARFLRGGSAVLSYRSEQQQIPRSASRSGTLRMLRCGPGEDSNKQCTTLNATSRTRLRERNSKLIPEMDQCPSNCARKA